MEKRLFTSECVTNGHPDKVADSISDAILDACLAQDPHSRVACETMVTTNFCIICGEITTKATVDYAAVAREAIRKIGYVYPGDGFDADTVEIQCRIHTQSADIALGTNDEVGGAGDQGMMFGGACTQTPELMPLPAALSRALCSRLTQCVHETDLLRPDGKTQVTVEFDEQGNVVGIDTVVVSIMHSADFPIEALRKYVRENVIAPVLERYGFHIENVAHIHINPTGNFVIGGPNGDTGLTGRKIIVDTYGGSAAHGGGCFSGATFLHISLRYEFAYDVADRHLGQSHPAGDLHPGERTFAGDQLEHQPPVPIFQVSVVHATPFSHFGRFLPDLLVWRT